MERFRGAHASRQEGLGLLGLAAFIERRAFQPGTPDAAQVPGVGAELGESLVEVMDTHGARMLPPRVLG